MNRITLLALTTSLLLTACDLTKKCYCLETFNAVDYVDGYCVQLSRKDIIEKIYVICLPNNPDADPEDYEYEITWNKNINTKNYTFVGGLEGKTVTDVFRVKDNTLRINVTGACLDQEATFGYLKISFEEFKSHGKASEDSTLYAYFAIGDSSDIVAKPEDITWK